MKAKNILRIVIGTALVLLVPLVAMMFTNEVNWDIRDFAGSGALYLLAKTAKVDAGKKG